MNNECILLVVGEFITISYTFLLRYGWFFSVSIFAVVSDDIRKIVAGILDDLLIYCDCNCDLVCGVEQKVSYELCFAYVLLCFAFRSDSCKNLHVLALTFGTVMLLCCMF